MGSSNWNDAAIADESGTGPLDQAKVALPISHPVEAKETLQESPGSWKEKIIYMKYYMRERWQFAYLFLGGRSCVLEDLRMRLILTSKRNIRNIE